MGLSAHQKNGGHDEWLTPPEILRALGTFDLDPCAPVVRPWDTAAKHYTVQDDGLALPWAGRVWCNPPFGREAVKWLRRMRDHGNGVALIPARTETAMFYETVWGAADGVLFLKGRSHFHYVDGRRADFNSGAPIALVAYGEANLDALRHSGLGFVVVGHNVQAQGRCAIKPRSVPWSAVLGWAFAVPPAPTFGFSIEGFAINIPVALARGANYCQGHWKDHHQGRSKDHRRDQWRGHLQGQ